MLSTARDMFRWHRALLGDHILDDAKRQLFAPRVREEAADPLTGSIPRSKVATPGGAVGVLTSTELDEEAAS
jgi:hypothetical protein